MKNLLEDGRILYISSTDISIGNGPGVNEREFILTLHELIGDRAHFLIPRPEKTVAEIPTEVCTYTLPYKRHPIQYWSHSLSMVRKANKLLSQRKFDLIVMRLSLFPVSSLGLTSFHRIPYAIKTLGVGPLNVLDEKGGRIGSSLNKLNHRMFKHLIPNAIVTDTDSTLHVEVLQDILGVKPHSIVWIDNTVNVKRFFPSSSEEAREELGLAQFDPIIGYIGSRPWERGGMQLIKSAPQLLKKYPNLGVVIIGSGIELEGMRQRAEDLNISDRIRLEGYVPFERIPLYVNSLDVGVSISLREDRQVNSELKVRQYLACGKPVVISPGSNDFVVEENFGSVVQPTDIDAISAELDYWLSLTSDERDAFSRKAVDYMYTNLSMEAGVNKRIDLWDERLQPVSVN